MHTQAWQTEDRGHGVARIYEDLGLNMVASISSITVLNLNLLKHAHARGI